MTNSKDIVIQTVLTYLSSFPYARFENELKHMSHNELVETWEVVNTMHSMIMNERSKRINQINQVK
jgi:hypothetical protein